MIIAPLLNFFSLTLNLYTPPHNPYPSPPPPLQVWEKIQEKLVGMGREITGLKKMISTWAKGVAKEKNLSSQFGESKVVPWSYGCASSLLSKIQEALGLDACRACFTAAAPIAPETIAYFASINIPVYEVS